MRMIFPDTKLFIDGRWLSGAGKQTLPVFNPATGVEIGRVACAAQGDLEDSVAAAQKGFQVWRDRTPAERARVLRAAGEIVRQRSDEIAHLLTLEQGKPIAEARYEVQASADAVDWFAAEGMRIYGRIVPARADSRICQMVLREPVGPTVAFTPWNFPVYQLVRKISAALAAGCSMIAKAPEETPASPAALVKAFADAGLPAGVLGLIYGDPEGISSYLITHPAVRKVSFTGSTQVGKKLASLAGAYMKRATMELGGHAPVIICSDADVDHALKSVGAAKFRNAGQVCTSPSRFLVHESLAKEFTQAFSAQAQALVVGEGSDPRTQMGPLANARRLDAMENLIEDARSKGAQLVTGGARIGAAGNFWAPTVIADVPLGAKAFNEEPFGPVAAIRTFQELDEAIDEANRLPYGLAAYAFTKSMRNVDLLSRRTEVGMLWINMSAVPSPEMPFGGVKDSGYGSEGGPEALEAYLNVRSVSVLNS